MQTAVRTQRDEGASSGGEGRGVCVWGGEWEKEERESVVSEMYITGCL